MVGWLGSTISNIWESGVKSMRVQLDSIWMGNEPVYLLNILKLSVCIQALTHSDPNSSAGSPSIRALVKSEKRKQSKQPRVSRKLTNFYDSLPWINSSTFRVDSILHGSEKSE